MFGRFVRSSIWRISRMLRLIVTVFTLPTLLLLGSDSLKAATEAERNSPNVKTETIEKLMVIGVNGTLGLDLNRLTDSTPARQKNNQVTLRFAISPDSFFTILVTNGVLRGPLPGSMGVVPQNGASLPATLNASLHQLALEKMPSDDAHD